MSTMRIRRAAAVVAVAALLLAPGAGISQEGTGTGRGPAAAGDDPPVAEARVTEQYRTIAVGGRLRPRSRIVHHAPNEGYVRSVDVTEGQTVAVGQRLFSVERRDDVGNVFRPLVATARVAGRVSKVLVEVEDAIDLGDPAVVIIGTGGYELEAYVSDKDAFKVDPGQAVTARTAGGAPARGVLAARSQEPDYETGLFTLTFSFTNHPGMNIGQFLLIDLPVDRERGVFVRRELAVRRYGRYFLWVVSQDQVLEAREVELGPVYGDQVKIDRGLDPGERYLARLTGREREGMHIGRAGD